MLPYFCPPPVPLTCVCEKPVTTSGIGAQPALGFTVQSGPGLHMPKGIDGPGKVRPTPSLPIRGSTYCQTCARQSVAVSSQSNMQSFRLIIMVNNRILGFCLIGLHIVSRLDAKLLLETFREIGGIREPNHITYFTDCIFPFKQ